MKAPLLTKEQVAKIRGQAAYAYESVNLSDMRCIISTDVPALCNTLEALRAERDEAIEKIDRWEADGYDHAEAIEACDEKINDLNRQLVEAKEKERRLVHERASLLNRIDDLERK